MILVVDNRDSFTFNLVQLLASLGAEVVVRRSDALRPRDALEARPRGVLLGPGPGTPERAGCTEELVRELGPRLPLLGVCLGHQALATALGGRLVRARDLLHGRAAPVEHDGRGLLAGIPSPFAATRYNSLVVDESSLPDELEVTGRGPGGEVQALRHRSWAAEGVQFHPESVRSEHGEALLLNFLRRAGEPLAPPRPRAPGSRAPGAR